MVSETLETVDVGHEWVQVVVISAASAVSLVSLVAVCICCYSDSSEDNLSEDDQSDLVNRQEKGIASPLPTFTSPFSSKSITLDWPSEKVIAVRNVQPDQFGQTSLNKSLGVKTREIFSKDSGGTIESRGSSSSLKQQMATMPDSADDTDTGDGAEGGPKSGTAGLGRIQFRVGYDFHQMTFTLKIMCAKGLPPKDFSGTSDPYVKIILLPDKKHKLVSGVKRKNLNPHWNESFRFEGFPYSKLMNKILYLQVLDKDRFSRDDPIGEVCLPLSDVNLANGETLWRDLQPCKGHAGKLGELLLSVCYQPNPGTITVVIIKARGLKAKDVNGLSDPYVKIWLMHDDKRVEKKKTKIKEKTLNPEFNETFIFNVSYEHIRQTSLFVSVMDHDRIKRNDLIGSVILSGKGAPMEMKHWNEMFSKPRQPISQWHVLKDFG